MAFARIRPQRRRGVVIPIVGARTREQLEDNLGALDIELSEAEMERLDEASRIELGFPYDFGGARLAYGETFGSIDDHRGLVDPIV